MQATSLAGFVQPLTLDSFAREFWSQRAVVLPAGSRPRTWLQFSCDAFKRAALRAGDGRLGTSRNDATGRMVVESIRGDQVQACFDAGLTVTLRQVQLFDPSLAILTSNLQSELPRGSTVDAYAFWSPPGAGLALHFDNASGLVLQVDGSKEWRYTSLPAVASPPVPVIAADLAAVRHTLPRDTIALPDESALQRTTLNTGDALYLPAGCWHSASASSVEGSLAVTLSFSTRPLYEVVASCIREELQRDATWRTGPSLCQPLPFSEELLAEQLAQLRALVANLQPAAFASFCNGDVGFEVPEPQPESPTLDPNDTLRLTGAFGYHPAMDDDGVLCFAVRSGDAAATVELAALGLLQALKSQVAPFRARSAIDWVPRESDWDWDEVKPILAGLIEHSILEHEPHTLEASTRGRMERSYICSSAAR